VTLCRPCHEKEHGREFDFGEINDPGIAIQSTATQNITSLEFSPQAGEISDSEPTLCVAASTRGTMWALPVPDLASAIAEEEEATPLAPLEKPLPRDLSPQMQHSMASFKDLKLIGIWIAIGLGLVIVAITVFRLLVWLS